MAYGDTLGEVTTVLKTLANKEKAEANQSCSQTCPETSCDQIFEPLKDLRRKLQNTDVSLLFGAILRIEEKEIDVSLKAFSSSNFS